MLHRIVFILGLGIATTSPASASTFSAIIGNPACGSSGTQQDMGSESAAVTLNDGGFNCAVSAQAYSGAGAVGFRATASFNGDSGPAGQARIQGGGNARMRDIYVTPLFDPTDPVQLAKYGPQVQVTLNAYLEGVGTADATGNATGANSIKAIASITGASNFGSPVTDSQNAFGKSGVTLSPSDIPFDNFSTSMTPSILQFWELPFEVMFNIDANVAAGTSKGGIASSTIEAYNSLSFSKTGPAFFLSDGYTVHAPELNIFNNRWVDPRATVTPSAVPVPASIVLLFAGLGAFGGLKLRSKKHP